MKIFCHQKAQLSPVLDWFNRSRAETDMNHERVSLAGFPVLLQIKEHRESAANNNTCTWCARKYYLPLQL